MDTNDTLPDMDQAKHSVAKELDHLLAPLIRACRFPVPPPAHLSEDSTSAHEAPKLGSSQHLDANRHGISSAAANARTAAVAAAAAEDEAVAERSRRADTLAYRTCVQHVPGLSRLEERLRKGRAAGAECETLLQQLLGSLGAMLEVTRSVQSQSEHLNQNASTLLLRKTRLEKVRDELERTVQHFTHMEDLVREAEDPMLSSTSSRFPILAEELNAEMNFLVRHANFKSAPVYAANVARAQQRIMQTLRTALRTSLQEATRTTVTSEAYTRAQPRTSEAHSGTDAGEDGALAHATDEAGQFAAALGPVNEAFTEALGSSVTLRRIAELLIGTTESAAVEAFGAALEIRGGFSHDVLMTDVLNAYRDARVAVVCPLLRAWVVASCTSRGSGPTADHLNRSQNTEPSREASVIDPTRGNLESSDRQDSASVSASLVKTPKSATRALAVRSSSFAGALMSDTFTLPYLAGHLCALMDVCLEGERDVLEKVWLRDDVTTTVLPKLVGEVTEEVYHAFRSRLLRVDGITELAGTIQSIQAVPFSAGRDRTQVREITELWQRMIQDTQERMIFRTSVFIRHDIGRARPTAEMAAAYVRSAVPPPPSASAEEATDLVVEESRMSYIPAVLNTVTLLKYLYPTLEFSVFATFAEEAIHNSLLHLQELARLVNDQDKRTTGRAQPFLGYACQVAHLLYLRVELSHIDANIVVVEKKLDFAALRRTRLAVIQSSRESKKDVDGELVTASDRLIQCMLSEVSRPLEGAARKSAQEAEEAVQQSEAALTRCEYSVRALIPAMADGMAPAEELLAPVRQHLDELVGTITTTHVPTRAHDSASPAVAREAAPAVTAEPAAGSLEEAARTATALADRAYGRPPDANSDEL